MALDNFLNNDDGLFTYSRKPVKSFQKGINRWNEYNDPTYLGFVFLFDWSTIQTSGVPNSPLLNRTATVGTAYSYLLRIGEKLRAAYLLQFIELLESINYNTPWYWQSFEGGEELWKYKKFNDPYVGGDDSVITIECLESIDLKMTLLMDLYRKAVYDQTYKRIIVPENLRKFEMEIHVQEIRKFQVDKLLELQNAVSKVSVPGVKNPVTPTGPEYMANRNENSPYIRWRLKFCEFDPDVSSAAFAGLNMAGSHDGFAKQKLAIKYELVEEPGNFYGLINTEVSSTNPNVDANNEFKVNEFEEVGETFKSLVEKKAKAVAKKLADEAAESILNKAQGKISKLVLGNVYGAGQDIRSALERGTIQSLGPDLINSIGRLGNNNSNKTSSGGLGNVFE